jgi:diguanylate cyclase (GGDEF)-like protein/PAS domain S-box-containing protein
MASISRFPGQGKAQIKHYYMLGLFSLASMSMATLILALVAQAGFEQGMADAAHILQQASQSEIDSPLRAAVKALTEANEQYREWHVHFRFLLVGIFLLAILLTVGPWHMAPGNKGQGSAILHNLKESQRRCQSIYTSIRDALLIVNPAGNIIDFNPGAERLFGYRSQELKGRSIQLLLTGPERSRHRELLERLLRDEAVTQVELPMLAQDGSVLDIELDSNPMWWHGERQYLWIARDLSGRNQLEEKRNESLFRDLLQNLSAKDKFAQEMARRAVTDPLTGAYNRARFDERLSEEIDRVGRHNSHLTLILLDIDHFKQVNDTYGHPAGDQVLMQLATIVRERLRSIDLFARWGGEEFAILAPDTDDEGAIYLAEKIRFAVEQHDCGEVGRVTISMGIAEYRPGESAGQLLRRVDIALYQAKETGRNRVVNANSGME